MTSNIGTFLKHVGGFFRKLFIGATEVAQFARPIVDIAFPSVASLYNFTVQQATLAEAAADSASGATGSGTQKLAAVVAAVTPYAVQALKADGVPAPTTAQITAYVNAVVASLNALPAPVAAPAATSAS